MKRLLTHATLLLLLNTAAGEAARADCSVSWNQLISSRAEHESCIRNYGADIPHFTSSWETSGGWNGEEGYMRWRVTQTMGEDGDGYWINHPTTNARPIFISFIAKVGSTWWTSHTSSDRFKFVMFLPDTQLNPRPTIFNMPIVSGAGAYSYRTFGPDLEAGGQGCDQFGNCLHNQTNGYPNHTYKEDRNGHNQWFFIVMSLESDRTKTYIWSQDGRLSGFYAQSLPAGSSLLSSWNAANWRTVLLLGYIEATTAGDANAYMDIGHIRVTQSLPSPPTGFVTGASVVPNPPEHVTAE